MRRDALLDFVQPGLFWAQNLKNRLTKGVTLGVRGLVTDEAGRILLVRHSYIAGWYFPGGAVEPGETAEVSLIRELEEEAGIAPVGEVPLLALYFNEIHHRRDHIALFRVSSVRRVRDFSPNLEIREADFFDRERLPEGTSEATRRRISEHLAGLPVSDRW